jgi:integrase
VADGSTVVTRLRRAAEEYLAMRRSLGFKLITQAAQLMSFVDYCESVGSDLITSDLALEWATTTRSGSTHDGYLARRLMTVRIFARHYKTLDPGSEIPPEDALPQHKCRIAPYLYSTGEITALLDGAARLRPPLRAATWQTLIGLLAVTGIRKSEACHLDDDHLDLDNATLIILDSKFGKSRRLFLHSSTIAALRSYRQRRDQWCPHRREPSFLVSTRGTRLNATNLSHTFTALVDAAGITVPSGQRRPRLHDLRHSFTVTTLIDFYRDGADVQARLPILSTWLGHVDPKSTYWYLQQVPELLTLAADRLESVGGEQ